VVQDSRRKPTAASFGILLAGFVPLSALLAVLNFGAGADAFLGSGPVTLLNPFIGPGA
jgi:hypothetical protein